VHRLLQRQLSKLDVSEEDPPTPERWDELLAEVDATYERVDQDRDTLERSIEVSSEEMRELYDELRTSSEAEIAKKNVELEAALSLRQAIEASVLDAIMVVDELGEVVHANPRFTETFGLSRDVLGDGACVRAFLRSQLKEPTLFDALLREGRDNPDVIQRGDLELLDGRVLERYSAAVEFGKGRTGRIVTLRDVTDARRLAADRVVVTERMAAVGQLVASVAHEINNPLAYIMGNVELLRESRQDGVPMSDEEVSACLSEAMEGLERVRVIVNDLRMLSRVDDDRRAPVDIHHTIASALAMASNHLKHKAQVVQDLRAAPFVLGNEARLTQVFLNLFVNAAQALPDGGANRNLVDISTHTDERGWVVVRLRDTGTGIPPEHLPRIFDPFFTTKAVGSGTGLGLSISRRIIESLGGFLSVESAAGAGATFIIELPPTAAPLGRLRASDLAAACPQRRSILVIDDDANIRRWLARALGKHDDVRTVGSVAEAMREVRANEFDAILCDVMMPDRTAADFHALVLEQSPHHEDRIIYMSGGAFTPALSTFFEQVARRRIDKPLSIEKVRGVVEEVVRSSRGQLEVASAAP
jgi:PAS domain S-box-containing protein